MQNDKVIACSNALASNKLTIAFAESATAGRLCSEFASAPGAGNVLKGGIVCYNVCVKTDILGIPQKDLDQFTPESAEITRELAQNLQKLIPSDIQIAVTGLTTPGGSESSEKPVGTMFIHIIFQGKSKAKKIFVPGSPIEVINGAVDAVAETLLALVAGQRKRSPSKAKSSDKK